MKKQVMGLGLVIGLLFFGIYLKCSAPTLYVGDSGEFIISALSLDISHPPGYPLFSLLARPLTILPYGHMAFRVNVISCLIAASSLTLAFFFFEFYVSIEAATLASSFFGLSYLFWNNAIAPEVYHLHLIFVVFVLFTWLKSQSSLRHLYLLAFLLGLGLGNHYLILYLFPLLGYSVYIHRQRLKPGQLTRILLCIILGSLIIIYFPLRSTRNPLLNWSQPANLTRLVSHVKRDVYNRLEFSTTVTFYEKALFIKDFLILLGAQFYFIYLPLVFLGLFNLFRRDRLLFWSSGYIFVSHTFFTILVFHFPYNSQNLVRVEPYYLPAFFISFLWLAYAWPLSFRISIGRVGVFLILSLLLPISAAVFYLIPANTSFANINHRSVFFPYYYGKNMAQSATLNSNILLSEDTEKNALFYLSGIEGYRKDLSLFSWNNFYDSGLSRRGNVYLSLERTFAQEKQFPEENLRFNNALFQFMKKGAVRDHYLPQRMNLMNLRSSISDYRFNWLTANSYLMLGFNRMDLSGNSRDALKYWKMAAAVGNGDYLTLNNVSTLLYRYGFYRAAYEGFQSSLRFFPRYKYAFYNLGLVALKLKKPLEAKEYFEKSLRIDPGYQAALRKLQTL